MWFHHQDTSGMGDVTASVVGAGFSMLLSVQFLQFAQEGLYALCFGALGALGGWIINRVLKWLEKRFRRW